MLEANWLNPILYSSIALIFLAGYFLKRETGFFRNRIVLALAAGLLVLAAHSVYTDFNNRFGVRQPSLSEINDGVFNRAQAVETDTRLVSPYGFSLTVPAGFRYVKFDRSAYLLLGRMTGESFDTMLTVKKYRSSESPARFLEMMSRSFSDQGSSIALTADPGCTLNDCNPLRFTAIHPGAGGPDREGGGLIQGSNGHLFYALGLCNQGDRVCTQSLESTLASFHVSPSPD